jgi:hypothetical protein
MTPQRWLATKAILLALVLQAVGIHTAPATEQALAQVPAGPLVVMQAHGSYQRGVVPRCDVGNYEFSFRQNVNGPASLARWSH